MNDTFNETSERSLPIPSPEEIIRLLLVGQLAQGIYEEGLGNDYTDALTRNKADALCCKITENLKGANLTPLVTVFEGRNQSEGSTTNFVIADGAKDLPPLIRRMAEGLIKEIDPLGYTGKIKNSSLGFWVVRLNDNAKIARQLAFVAPYFSILVNSVGKDITEENRAQKELEGMGIHI